MKYGLHTTRWHINVKSGYEAPEIRRDVVVGLAVDVGFPAETIPPVQVTILNK